MVDKKNLFDFFSVPNHDLKTNFKEFYLVKTPREQIVSYL